MDVSKTIDKKIDYWKKKLIDLSKRNNLISFRFTKSKTIKITLPELDQVLEDLNHEKDVLLLKKENKKVTKEREWQCSEEEEIIEKKLYNIYLKSKENFQEQGINTCFVSFGNLNFKEADSSEIIQKAPIFLFPVEIIREKGIPGNTHRFKIMSGSGDISLNPAIREKLSHDFNIKLKDIDKENFKPKEYLKYLAKEIAGKKSWSVDEGVFIDIFSYQRYIMYKDIETHRDLVKNSPLIKAYVGDRDALQDEISEVSREEFDDTTGVDVLPADSSQKRAIELAKAGVTFVLQGPPGTGKSQTISNMIAALIENKKKVLFVSQKMAALDVVKKRLDEVGLGRYCLNLHNYKGNKKEVTNQLITELETSPKIKDEMKRYSFTNYLDSQKILNEFYEYLCEKHKPRSLSIYDVRGELAKLHDIEILDSPLISSSNLDEEKFSSIMVKLNDMDRLLGKVTSPLDNVLFNFKTSKDTILSLDKFKKLVKKTNYAIEEIEIFNEKINFSTKYKIKSLKEFREFIELHKKVKNLKNIPKFLISNKFKEYYHSINEFYNSLEKIENLKKEFSKMTKPEFLTPNIKKEEKIFKEASIFSRLTNKEYKNAKITLDKLSKQKIKHNGWIELFKKKEVYSKEIKKYSSVTKKYSKEVSNYGNLKDLKNLAKLKGEAEELSKIYKLAENFNKTLFYKVVEFMFKEKLIEKEFNNLKSLLKETEDYFDKDNKFEKENIAGIKKDNKALSENIVYLDDILNFKQEYISLDQELKKFVQKYFEDNRVSRLSSVFLKSYYSQLLEKFQTKLNLKAPKEKLELFRKLDFEVRDVKRYKIMDFVEKEQPAYNYQSYGENEVSILKRENQKKRKLKPVRDLLTLIPKLAFSLKPCFMMSPLTVSQYIDPKKIKFDVVIFDEASQIMPEDAVPCLVRANQTIIMGDTQQLPPTSFFMSSQEDEDVEEEIEDLESFLSEASTKFRSKSLDWHYRSQNENLIAFSNRFFYENKLITFPNPNPKDKNGLDFVHVKEGIYDRGKSRKNRVEAKEIVNTYIKLKKEHPHKSFGIIAFSIAQENAIREAFQQCKIDIDTAIDSHKEDLFIKNLETVQGDERDIILLSVGYGKDSNGKFSYNFGPLNRDGGYKRLNVAITRSRFKTVIFSSILPEDLEDGKVNAEGVKFLKYYLDYAKNKNFTKFLQVSEGIEFDSGFEEVVYDTLSDEGFSMSSQVGCSGYRVDLAIKHPKHPGQYILGIECDGAQYHSSKYARDRDKVRQVILEKLGWNIHRIWSDDWLNNREYEIKKIKEKVSFLLKKKIKKIEEENFSEVEEVNDFEEKPLKDKYKRYRPCNLSGRNINLEFDGYGDLRYDYEDEITKDMRAVIDIESPIEKEWLFRKVLKSYGIQKLGVRLERFLEKMLRELGVYVKGNTVSKEPISTHCTVRVSKETQRPFSLIPKEEISGAIVDILENTFSISKKALSKDIAKGIYHYKQIGSKIERKIDEALKHLIKNKIIVEFERGYKLNK